MSQLELTNFPQISVEEFNKIDETIPETPINKWTNKFHCGHILELAKQLPDESIDTIITSPPYFNLRNYKTEHVIWDGDEKCEHDFVTTTTTLNHMMGLNERIQKENQNESSKFVSNSFMESNKVEYAVCTKCSAWKGNLGSEPDPNLFIKHLVDIFSALQPKLKKSGTLFVNISDSYFGGCGGPQSFERKQKGINWNEKSERNPRRKDKSMHKWMKPKQLMLIPSRFAIAMQESGFILRNSIIWQKPNHMPVSVKDRFSNSYEHIFFFVKSKKYFFNLDEIREPHKTSLKSLQNRIDYDTERRGGKLQEGKIGTGQWSTNKREINPLGTTPPDTWKYSSSEDEPNNFKSIKERMAYARRVEGKDHDSAINNPLGKTPEDTFTNNFPKNPNSMLRLNTLPSEEKMHPLGKTPEDFFSMNTHPFSGAHFACFPISLPLKLITAGCPKEVCSKCGKPIEQIIKKTLIPLRKTNDSGKVKEVLDAEDNRMVLPRARTGIDEINTYAIIGQTKCNCNAKLLPGVVLDPFMGAGSTAIACEMRGVNWIGVDLSQEYITNIAEPRLKDYRESKKFTDINDFKEIKKLIMDAEQTIPLNNFIENDKN